MKTKYFLIGIMVALMGSCSSGSDNDNTLPPDGGDDDQWSSNLSTFDASAAPTWAVDWSFNATAPDWQEPTYEDYECSMDFLVILEEDLKTFAGEGDIMAMFIGDECRAVSYPNKMSDGQVAYLLHIKGSSEEVNFPMELRFYCEKLHSMNITGSVPPFTPNNLMDDTYQLHLSAGEGSTKYPYFTELTVSMSDHLPFTIGDQDKLAVFVGDECRGIGVRDEQAFEGWRTIVYSRQPNETAQVRYYSADKGGVYTILKTFTLNNSKQAEAIEF